MLVCLSFVAERRAPMGRLEGWNEENEANVGV